MHNCIDGQAERMTNQLIEIMPDQPNNRLTMSLLDDSHWLNDSCETKKKKKKKKKITLFQEGDIYITIVNHDGPQNNRNNITIKISLV